MINAFVWSFNDVIREPVTLICKRRYKRIIRNKHILNLPFHLYWNKYWEELVMATDGNHDYDELRKNINLPVYGVMFNLSHKKSMYFNGILHDNYHTKVINCDDTWIHSGNLFFILDNERDLAKVKLCL